MKRTNFTKSAFKIALECITQLYYTGKKQEYADKSLDDDFLLALAKGGYQVGELAKYYFCEDPLKEKITITSINSEEAIEETQRRLNQPGRVVIAEAAFSYKQLLVRVDLVVKENDHLYLYEVKAKSVSEDEPFINSKGTAILSNWVEYLYDIAFQRYVVRNSVSNQGYKVKANLLLVNKSTTTDIDGLHQFFKVYSENGRIRVETKAGTCRKDLGSTILKAIPVDDVCDKIENEFAVPSDLYAILSFEGFIFQSAEHYLRDDKIATPLGAKCKSCRFIKNKSDSENLLNGFVECWKTATKLPLIDRALVTELWNGASGPRSYAAELIKANKYFIYQIDENDIAPVSNSKKTYVGLTPHLRRMEQVNRDKARNTQSYFDPSGMKGEMTTWKFPLHAIDFETTSVAIPFFKGMRSYEGIAFQFSHHTVDKEWNVRHQTQFLSFEPGVFPNFDFVRNLKVALSNDDGTIFRYHNHENTYLNFIYAQLDNHPNPPIDKNELQQFIASITHDHVRGAGKRDMIDLYDLVLRYYYSPLAKGSNSLKQILPSIIAESDYLKNKYGRTGMYGRGQKVSSLNFDDHVWIRPEFEFNPYKTLPKVFDEYEQDQLDGLLLDMENVSDGGSAMMAYNYLQFSSIPIDQRVKIKDSLLRYCELDTLAMVMLLEGWKAMIEKK